MRGGWRQPTWRPDRLAGVLVVIAALATVTGSTPRSSLVPGNDLCKVIGRPLLRTLLPDAGPARSWRRPGLPPAAVCDVRSRTGSSALSVILVRLDLARARQILRSRCSRYSSKADSYYGPESEVRAIGDEGCRYYIHDGRTPVATGVVTVRKGNLLITVSFTTRTVGAHNTAVQTAVGSGEAVASYVLGRIS